MKLVQNNCAVYNYAVISNFIANNEKPYQNKKANI